MIPVVVLTTSREEQDRIDSFQSNVADYIVEPVNYLQFVEMVRMANI